MATDKLATDILDRLSELIIADAKASGAIQSGVLAERLIHERADAVDAISAMQATVTALEAENKRLREANEALARGLEFYANPAVYAPHPHGPAFDRRDISYRAKNALAEFRGEAELPPNYAACCSSTNLDACDCVNKRHIRVLFSRGGKRKYQPIGDPL